MTDYNDGPQVDPDSLFKYIIIGMLATLILMLVALAYHFESMESPPESLPELMGRELREFRDEFNEGFYSNDDTLQVDTTEQDSVHLDTRPMGL